LLGLRIGSGPNNLLPYAIVGQALLDEGSILTDKVEIFYNVNSTARFVFETARLVGLAKNFRRKFALHQEKFGFTIPMECWARLYRIIGPLPDKRKDSAFRFLLRAHPRGALRPKGESKRLVMDALQLRPMTGRELCYAVGLSGSTIRGHLRDLAREGKVKYEGRNKESTNGKSRSAFVWSADIGLPREWKT
jgi:DNA-binding transcriptional ArsR family regulator